MSLRIWLVY